MGCLAGADDPEEGVGVVVDGFTFVVGVGGVDLWT